MKRVKEGGDEEDWNFMFKGFGRDCWSYIRERIVREYLKEIRWFKVEYDDSYSSKVINVNF